jgi:hypothetical protein
MRLAQAAATLGVTLVLPRTAVVRPADVGPVWVAGKKPRERTVAVTFPARGVIVEYTRPAPSNGSAAHFRAVGEGIQGSEFTLNGVPALAVRQNSDMTGANFGLIAFNVGDSEIRVMGHEGEATLEASALSILTQSAARSVSHHYSVRKVEQAFAAQGIRLRNVTRKDFRGLVAFLDGMPSHAVYAYVVLKGCKCALNPPIRNAGVTRHGNVEVLWLRNERAAVRAALRELD